MFAARRPTQRCVSHLNCRFKSMKKFWSPSSQKRTSIDRALQHFDSFYGSVFGDQWNSMRKALLMQNKYVAVVNNFSDDKETAKFLESIGAHDIRKIFDVQKMLNDANTAANVQTTVSNPKNRDAIKDFAQLVNRSELESMYTKSNTLPERLEVGETTLGKENTNGSDKSNENAQIDPSNISLISSLNTAEIDESRIIDPKFGMSASELWTFVPATKIKGAEDWVPESHYFNYYKSTPDFPFSIEEDGELIFPEHLKIYLFEEYNHKSFPEPRKGSTGVLNYYLMDGASIIPVLALDLKLGDKVLDLCAAPGGKALIACQTMMPDVVVCNDESLSRVNRMHRVFKDYLHNYENSNVWRERVIIKNVDGRKFEDESKFDKVLIDVPCTIDRHSVNVNENSIFNPMRVKERLKIPELQSELLCNALKLCCVGGCVVYSTCTFSPIQNDGVIHMALKRAWEDYGIKVSIKLLHKSFEYASPLYKFGKNQSQPRYGLLVTPHASANFGPLYVCKLVRTQ